MGIFSKLFTAAAAKSASVIKQGAKQAQKGKTGFAVNAFSKAGQNAKKYSGKKR